MGRDSYNTLGTLDSSLWNDVPVRLFLEEQLPCCLPTFHAIPHQYGREKKRVLNTNAAYILEDLYPSVSWPARLD